MPRRLFAALLFSALALSPLAASAQTEAVDSRVVVAPPDSGINPYHDRFQVAQSNVTPDILAEFGIDAAHVLHISDNYDADVASGVYDGVQEGENYWFEGTNIIVWSSGFGGGRPFLPDDENDTH